MCSVGAALTFFFLQKNIKRHVLPAPSARHSRRPTRASGKTPRRGPSCRRAGSLRGGSAGSLRTRCGRRLRPRVACFPPRCLNNIPERSGPWYIYYINSLSRLLLRISADDDFACHLVLQAHDLRHRVFLHFGEHRVELGTVLGLFLRYVLRHFCPKPFHRPCPPAHEPRRASKWCAAWMGSRSGRRAPVCSG